MIRAVDFRGRRLAPAALLSFTLVLGACGETSTEPAAQAPSREAPQAVITNTVNWTNQNMTLALGNVATGFPFMAPFFNEITWWGSGTQTALLSTSTYGFPTDGTAFLSVSSGDAAVPGNSGGSGACSGGRCNIGGVSVPIFIAPTAHALHMDVRYWGVDYLPYEDPFRIYVEVGPVRTLIFEATTSSEFGGGSGFRWAAKRNVTIDLTPYRGRRVNLIFEASDLSDTVNPAGAVIDNVRMS